jgi:hypothetical protein
MFFYYISLYFDKEVQAKPIPRIAGERKTVMPWRKDKIHKNSICSWSKAIYKNSNKKLSLDNQF